MAGGTQDRVMPTIIIAFTFVAVYFCLLLALTPIVANAMSASGDYNDMTDSTLIAGQYYTLYQNNLSSTAGYTLTNTTVQNALVGAGVHTGAKWLHFHYAGEADVWITVVRNNINHDANSSDLSKKYLDYIYVERYTPWLWIFPSWTNQYIPFANTTGVESVMKGIHSSHENTTSIPISIGEEFTVFVGVPHTPFSKYLNWNQETITFGQSQLDTTKAETNAWAIMTKMLTLQLPNMNATVQLLIATPFWVALIVASLLLVRQFLPF